MSPTLVLASSSEVRARVLRGAGVPFEVDPADVDETATKREMEAGGADTDTIAATLARRKADAVSARHPRALVLGADQIMDLDGRRFDKPVDMADARHTLLAIRGRTHHLVTSAVLVRDGEATWAETRRVSLTVRDFSDEFLEEYLAAAGTAILSSVGAYRLEDVGAQLFSAVDGDYFTILGLPLLPILGILRREGVLRD